MATDEDIYKLILKTEGEEKARTLSAAVALAEQKFRTLLESLGSADASTRAAAGALSDLQAKLRATQAEAGLSSNKLLQLGNTLDDLQYVGEQGLRPILNNIMQMSPILGVAMMAVNQLYRHWDDIAKLWGGNHTQTEAERMEELGKKTAKTADETERLAKWERAREAVKHQETAPTEAQAAQTKAVNEAVVEAGVDKVDAAIRAIHGRAIQNARPEEEVAEGAALQERRKAINDRAAAGQSKWEDAGDAHHIDGRLAELAAKEEKRVADWVRDLRGRIATDPGALAAFTADLQRTGQSPELAEKLRKAQQTPAEKREDDEDRKAQEHFDAQEREHNNKLETWKEAGRSKEEEEARRDQEHAEQAERDFANRKAQWEEQGRIKEEEEERRAQEHFEKGEREHADKLAHFEAVEGPAQAVETAKKENPAIESLIHDSLKAAGGGDGEVDRLIARLTATLGAETARTLVEGQVGGVRGELAREFVEGPQEERRSSQVIDSAGLADSIQAAVGGNDKQQKMIEQQMRSNVLLQQIATRPAAPSPPTLRR